MLAKPRIYLSCPAEENLLPDQLVIKHETTKLIEQAGFEVAEFHQSGIAANLAWSFREARSVMSRCQGAVILGLVRHRLNSADGKNVDMTTEYAHYEGALAHMRGIPTLVMAEKFAEARGILSRGADQLVQSVPRNATATWFRDNPFWPQFQRWTEQVRGRSQVFLGYCGKAKSTADAIIAYLTHLGVSVKHYGFDFVAGGTILEEIERSCRDSAVGIFLFTKDDPLEGGDARTAAPRDNVVFEAGFFTALRGKECTLIIREDGAKMPADLGGNIYLPLKDRADITPIQAAIRQFLETRL